MPAPQAGAAGRQARSISPSTGCARRSSSARSASPPPSTRRSASEADIAAATALPGILKTCTEGYDGKGQVRVADRADARRRLGSKLGGATASSKRWSISRCEISVIVARGLDGADALLPDRAQRPSRRHPAHHDRAVAPGRRRRWPTAERYGAELARRPRSRGPGGAGDVRHQGRRACSPTRWRRGRTIPATGRSTPAPPASSSSWCARSAACRWAPVDVLTPSRMENLIGDEADDWPRYLADPTARLHLYGKAEARPGRKMGHVTFLKRVLTPRSAAGPRLDLRLQLLDLHDVVDAPVEEAPGRLAARRAVVQPVEQRRGVDAGQGRPLGVEIEIGAGVAGGVPHGVDRLYSSRSASGALNGSDEQRQRPARRLAVAGMALEPDADGGLDAVADLQAGDALLLHVLDRAQVGALADMGQQPDRPAGEQPVGLAGRQRRAGATRPAGRPGSSPRRRPRKPLRRPAGHAIRRRDRLDLGYFQRSYGKYRAFRRGFPRVFPCDTTAAS